MGFSRADYFSALKSMAGDRLPGRPEQKYWQRSAVQNYVIGSRMQDEIGRAFRYSQVGDGTYGATLAATQVRRAYGVYSAVLSNDPEYSVTTVAVPPGRLQVPVLSIGAFPANHFQNGHLVIGSGASFGFQYRIRSHPASTAPGQTIVFTLYEPILVALGLGETTALYRNRYADVRSMRQEAIEAIGAVNLGRVSVVGAPLVDALAGEFLWLQVKGPAFVVSGSGAEGTNMDERQLLWDRDGSVELVNIDYPLAQARQYAGYLIAATNTALVLPAVGCPGGYDGMMYMHLECGD